jgi:hypothetical protein
MNRLDSIENTQLRENIPNFQSGDSVRVHVRIQEGNKERLQIFEGIVIARKHGGNREFSHCTQLLLTTLTSFAAVRCAALNFIIYVICAVKRLAFQSAIHAVKQKKFNKFGKSFNFLSREAM